MQRIWQKITFMMDWVIGGKHAMFYPALVKGYYKEEGLDVTLVRGHGSSGTVQAVDQGRPSLVLQMPAC